VAAETNNGINLLPLVHLIARAWMEILHGQAKAQSHRESRVQHAAAVQPPSPLRTARQLSPPDTAQRLWCGCSNGRYYIFYGYIF
jgi:hypothetical protein